MKPFKTSPSLNALLETYPSVDVLLEASTGGDRDARYAISRLWLSEGIPYCFRTRPSLYEAVRHWMARRLNVQAKEITLIGSGRQGFCLTTGGNLGQAFGEHSDLDFTVISNILFQRLKETFDRWAADYSDGTVNPRNETERYYWDANKKSVPDGIQRGFIDPHKIPWWNRYREAQMVAQTMYEAHKKLKVTDDAPNVRKCSVRAYRDWDSFIRQMAINLEAVSQHAP